MPATGCRLSVPGQDSGGESPTDAQRGPAPAIPLDALPLRRLHVFLAHPSEGGSLGRHDVEIYAKLPSVFPRISRYYSCQA